MELDFSNLIFQKSSTDEYGDCQECHFGSKNCVMIKLDQKYILISAGDSEKSQKHSDLPLGKREA